MPPGGIGVVVESEHIHQWGYTWAGRLSNLPTYRTRRYRMLSTQGTTSEWLLLLPADKS